MIFNSLEQLVGLNQADLDLLKALQGIGAATAEEVALKLNRPGEDLTIRMDQLVERNLVEKRTTVIGEETFQVYLLDPLVRRGLYCTRS